MPALPTANELDGWNGTDRFHFNAIIDPQDLSDTYLVPFQACVEQGDVSGIMVRLGDAVGRFRVHFPHYNDTLHVLALVQCSYNAVNGVPSCANDWLLRTVLRQGWGFDGYVTADCDADSDVYNSHHYTATPEEAVADVLLAGTDVDCGGFVTQNVNSTLQQGLITEADIDTVLKRLFRVRLRLGFFEPPGGLQTIGLDQVRATISPSVSAAGPSETGVD
jgi:xylan 1,4-beta-xylosidase